MSTFYDTLAAWWPLISPVEDYAEEVEFFLPLLAEVTSRPAPTLLELGSGGGNNAFHLKHAFHHVTLTDLSDAMLAVSRQLNPDCDHHPGDMRTLRLGQTFDAVFIHDAIDYMTTLDDLRAALTTAAVHCKPGGLLLIVPDHVRDHFDPDTEHGGVDIEGRRVRYLEWSYDPDPRDSTCVTDYVFIVREGDTPSAVYHERHIFGLFTVDEWLAALAEAGFQPESVRDPYDRHVFIGRKPPAPTA